MVFEIQGKFALVTGGASGIGLEYSKELLRNGLAGVLIADIDEKKGVESVGNLNKQHGENKAVFVKTDVTKADELENAYKVAILKFGVLDIVINNAGILRDSVWELEININCNATVRSTLLAMKHLGKNSGGRGGVVVNISSIAGLQTMEFCPIYVGTKHFVQAFTRSLAAPSYFDSTGVSFRTICPGVTETPLIFDMEQYLLPGFNLDKPLGAALPTLKTQKPEFVSKSVIKAIKEGKNGSVWNPEGGKLYQVNFPSRFDFITEVPL